MAGYVKLLLKIGFNEPVANTLMSTLSFTIPRLQNGGVCNKPFGKSLKMNW